MYGIPSRFLREIPGPLINEVRPRVQVSRPYAPQARREFAVAAIDPPPVKLGANVRHPTFGTGVVTDYEGTGAHARVQVNFDDCRIEVAGARLREPAARLIFSSRTAIRSAAVQVPLLQRSCAPTFRKGTCTASLRLAGDLMGRDHNVLGWGW
jgi:hypothetical protein